MRKTIRFSVITIILMMLLTLISCVPSSVEKAVKKLEKKGYSVDVRTESIFIEYMDLPGLVEYISAEKGECENMNWLTAYYFGTSQQAKDSFELIQKEMRVEQKDEIFTLKCKRSGRIVYYGTERAVKDFD